MIKINKNTSTSGSVQFNTYTHQRFFFSLYGSTPTKLERKKNESVALESGRERAFFSLCSLNYYYIQHCVRTVPWKKIFLSCYSIFSSLYSARIEFTACARNVYTYSSRRGKTKNFPLSRFSARNNLLSLTPAWTYQKKKKRKNEWKNAFSIKCARQRF